MSYPKRSHRDKTVKLHKAASKARRADKEHKKSTSASRSKMQKVVDSVKNKSPSASNMRKLSAAAKKAVQSDKASAKKKSATYKKINKDSPIKMTSWLKKNVKPKGATKKRKK